MAIYLLDRKDRRSRRPAAQSKSTGRPVNRRRSSSRSNGETIGTHQGFIHIQGEDNLAADDVRYFTFDVRPPFRVLIAAPQPVERYTFFLTEALSPSLSAQERPGRVFECETISLDKLLDKNLDNYSAVCLLDPTPLDAGRMAAAADVCRRGRRTRHLARAQRQVEYDLQRSRGTRLTAWQA